MVQQVTPILSQLRDKWEVFLTDGSVSSIHGFSDSKILRDYVIKITSNLSLIVPYISESCIKIKIKLNFYFHTSLWCLRRFYEDLLRNHK